VHTENVRGKRAGRRRGSKSEGKRGAAICLALKGLKPPCPKTLAACHRHHNMKVLM